MTNVQVNTRRTLADLGDRCLGNDTGVVSMQVRGLRLVPHQRLRPVAPRIGYVEALFASCRVFLGYGIEPLSHGPRSVKL